MCCSTMAIRADRLSFGNDALATVTPVAFAKSGRSQRLNEAQAANTTIEGGVLGYHVSGASGIPEVRSKRGPTPQWRTVSVSPSGVNRPIARRPAAGAFEK